MQPSESDLTVADSVCALLQDVVSLSKGASAIPISSDAVECGVRQKRRIQFLKFHDTVPLPDSTRKSEPKRLFGGSFKSLEDIPETTDPPGSPQARPSTKALEDTSHREAPAGTPLPDGVAVEHRALNGSLKADPSRAAKAALVSPQRPRENGQTSGGTGIPVRTWLNQGEHIDGTSSPPRPIGQLRKHGNSPLRPSSGRHVSHFRILAISFDASFENAWIENQAFQTYIPFFIVFSSSMPLNDLLRIS